MTPAIPNFRYLSRQDFARTYSFFTVTLLLLPLICTSGCIGIFPGSAQKSQSPADVIMARAKAFNSDIFSSKGSGRLVLTRGYKTEHYKIAWAAKAPNQLRMTLLMSGHPVETVAATGQEVTFISHTGRHKPHSTVSADPDLNSYIDIPVHLSDMVSLFLGRVPVRPFSRAWSEQDQTEGNQPNTYFASQRFSSKIQEVSSDSNGRIICYRLLDKNRDMIFGIWYSQFFECSGFTLPGLIAIKDRAGRTIEICLKNLLPNIPVKESVFRLTGS